MSQENGSIYKYSSSVCKPWWSVKCRVIVLAILAGLRPPDTHKATLQTLNRELQAACPSAISKYAVAVYISTSKAWENANRLY